MIETLTVDPHPEWPHRPRIVTLCGSLRYEEEIRRVCAELTVQGCAVFSLVAVDDAGRHKDVLDWVHRFKISFSDEVLIVNPASAEHPGGYIGKATRSEIAYTESLGKPIAYLVTREDTPDE